MTVRVLVLRVVVLSGLVSLLVAGLPVGPNDPVSAGVEAAAVPQSVVAKSASRTLKAPTPAEVGRASRAAVDKTGRPERVMELRGRRTGVSKSFVMSDGSTQVELSTRPVHYKTDKGRWRDIDTDVVAGDGDSVDAFVNSKNVFKSKFGKSTDRLLTFIAEQGSVTIGAAGEKRKIAPSADGNVVTFADVFGTADVRYGVSSEGVKEDIVLDTRGDVSDEFVFTVRTSGLTAKQLDDGSIGFYKRSGDERPAFVMPAPFMYDSSEANGDGESGFSDDVTQSLEQQGGTTTVTITPDQEWLADPDREFPVVVDPSVWIVPELGGSQDAYVSESAPLVNTGGRNGLKTGVDGNGNAHHSLLRFDVSMIPAGATISSADLNMHFSKSFSTDVNEVPLEARRITESWSENSVTWNTEPGFTTGKTSTRYYVADQTSLWTEHEGPWEEVADPAAGGGSYTQLASGTGPDSFTWNAWLPSEGDYTVAASYLPRADRGSPTYTVAGDEGSTTTVMDQTSGTATGQWRFLAEEHFTPGEPASVTMTRQEGATATAPMADSVRFVKYARLVKPVGASDQWHSYGVGNAVQRWVDGVDPNYGLAVIPRSDDQPVGGLYYQSGEDSFNGEDSYAPHLVVTYDEPGVTVSEPDTLHASGAELAWDAYVDPGPKDTDNLVEYQIFRGCTTLPGGACANPVGDYFHTSDPAGLELVGTVASDVTSFTDTTAMPSTADEDAVYNYWVVARTEADTQNGQDGRAASNAVTVTTPREGRIYRVFSGDTSDTTLSKALPDTVLPDKLEGVSTSADGYRLQTGNRHSTYGVERAMVEFDTSLIKQGVKVTDARLEVFQTADSKGTGGTFDVHALTRDFVEGEATWNQATTTIDWTSGGGDYDATVLGSLNTGESTDRLTFASTALVDTVQGWVDESGANHGLLMKKRDEAADSQTLSLVSSESSDHLFRPRLVVEHLAKNDAETFVASEVPERFVPGTIVKTPVTVTNTSNVDWPAGLELSYRWTDPGSNEDVTTSGERNYVPLGRALAVGESVTLELPVRTPINSDTGAKRQAYDLYLDLWDPATQTWFSDTRPPSDNTTRPSQDCAVMTNGLLCVNRFVEDPRSTLLGLEKFYSYAGESTGAGGQLLTNLASGNVSWSYDALTVPSIGPDSFVRVAYNSRDRTHTPAGFGVSVQPGTLNRLGSTLSVPTGGSTNNVMTFIDGDGTTHTYRIDQDTGTATTYVRPAGVAVELHRDKTAPVGRQWVFTRPDGTRFFFSQDTGLQTAVADTNGNELSFDYDADGRLTRVVDATGRETLTLGYNSAGLAWIRDISGRGLRFTHSSSHQLVTLEDGGSFDPVTGEYGVPAGEVKGFGFDYTSTSTNDNALLNQVSDPRGATTAIAYYSSTEDSAHAGWPKQVTDRRGFPTSYAYSDPDGSAGKDRAAVVTDANGLFPAVTSYRMDGYGRTTSIIDANANAQGADYKTTLGWDTDHNVIRLEEPNEAVSTWEFDDRTGYPVQIRDAEAVADDEPGTRLEYERKTGPGEPTVLTKKTSPAGRVNTFGYDSKGNLLRVRNEEAQGVDYTYNTNGTLASATQTGHTESTTYGTYDVTGYPQRITDPDGAVTEFTYDVRGNVLQVIAPDGGGVAVVDRTTTAEYDHFGRPTVITTPYQEGGVTSSTATTYDLNDNVTKETAANGAVTSYTFDAGDLVTGQVVPDNNTTGRELTFSYDGLGRVIEETAPNGTATTDDADDFVTRYSYDRLGQILEVTTPFEGADGTTNTPVWSFEYDRVGNKTAEIDPERNVSPATDYTTRWTYDLNHRVTETTDAAGYTSKVEYDADGLMTAEIDQLGNKRRTVYDQAGQKIEVHVPHTPAGSTDAEDRVTRWRYDLAGNVIRETRPSGKFSETVYDSMNRPIATKSAFDASDPDYGKPAVTFVEYDLAGRLARQSDPTYGTKSDADWTEYTYHPSGQIKTSTDPWQITTTYAYDELGQQTSRTLKGAGDDATRVQSWGYWPDGSIRARSDRQAQQPVDIADNADRWRTYQSGTWDTVDAGINTVGANYRTHAPAAAGSPEADDFFRWQTTPAVGGNMDVLVSCPVRSDTTTAASYTIVHDGSTSTATIDQSACTADTPWIKLGNYTFAGGRAQSVMVKPSADGVVVADAVKFVATDEPTQRSFTYDYDRNGAQTTVTDTTPGADIDTYTTAYDGLGRPATVEERSAGSQQRVTDYTYDLNSNTLSAYARRVAGANNSEASRYTQYSWDVRNLVDTVTAGDSPADVDVDEWIYTYGPRGMLDTLTKPNGNIVSASYHEDGLPKVQAEYTSATNGETLVSRHRMTYTRDGDLAEDVARVDKARTAAKDWLYQTTRYEYTPVRKLASVTKTGADHGDNEAYVYDAAGNITEQKIGALTTTFTYDRNRLLTSHASPGFETRHHHYDVFGRATTVTSTNPERPGETVVQRHAYDGYDRLIRQTDGVGASQTITEASFDPFDRTTTQNVTVGGDTTNTRYVYLGLEDQVAVEEEQAADTGAWQVSTRYTYAPNGSKLSLKDTPVDAPEGADTYFYGSNPHGDIETLTDQSGQTTSTYRYNAYGTLDEEGTTGDDKPTGDPAQDADVVNPYRFNAHRVNGATGTYDMGFRNYNPGLNRFLTRDMYNGALSDLALGADPWNTNRYAFTGGNPINRLELDGHDDCAGLGCFFDTLDVFGDKASYDQGALSSVVGGLEEITHLLASNAPVVGDDVEATGWEGDAYQDFACGMTSNPAKCGEGYEFGDKIQTIGGAASAARSLIQIGKSLDNILRATDDAANAASSVWAVDTLSASGSRLVGKDLTRAGQELAKHAGQGRFPVPKGSPSVISRMGQEQLDDILTYSGTRIEDITKGNFAGGRYYIAPDGRGAAFDSSGVFQYFGVFGP